MIRKAWRVEYVSRPKSVKKEYPVSFLYIVNYYLDNIDFYHYRSGGGHSNNNFSGAHLTVGMEENGIKIIDLTTTESQGYRPSKFKHMKDALLRWLQKRKVYNYVLTECPKSDAYRVKSLVDSLDYK